MTLSLRGMVLGTIIGALLASQSIAAAAEPNLNELQAAAKTGAEAARVKAIDELASLGSKAGGAVPTLTQLVGDPSPKVRAHAAQALGAVGEAAKPAAAALANLAKDENETVRQQAVHALTLIRPGPAVMVPLFTRLLEDSDPGVQVRILHAIAQAGTNAVPSLIEALQNEKAAYWACLILREIGPDAKAAVPALATRLKDSRPEVRREAVLALGAMADAAAPVAGEIAPLLDDQPTATAATFALGQIGQLSAGVEPKIRTNTKSDDKLLSTVSLWALARAHPEDKALRREAGEQLVARLSDKDPFVRVGAARALAALRLDHEVLLPIAEKALSSADEVTAHHALDAIAALGAPSVPRLIEALKHQRLRAQIAYILGQIGPPAAAATDSLTKLLDDKDSKVAREAAIALAKIGPAASASVPALSAALKRPNDPNAHAIAFALGKIGPAASASKADLLALAGSDDQPLAVVAAWALMHLDRRSAETAPRLLPILTAGLSSPHPETRQMAAETLGELGAAASSALAPLEKVSDDQDSSVRSAAAEAVAAIRGGKSK